MAHKWEMPLPESMPPAVRKLAAAAQAYGQLEVLSKLSKALHEKMEERQQQMATWRDNPIRLLAHPIEVHKELNKTYEDLVAAVIELLQTEHLNAEEAFRRALNV